MEPWTSAKHQRCPDIRKMESKTKAYFFKVNFLSRFALSTRIGPCFNPRFYMNEVKYTKVHKYKDFIATSVISKLFKTHIYTLSDLQPEWYAILSLFAWSFAFEAIETFGNPR